MNKRVYEPLFIGKPQSKSTLISPSCNMTAIALTSPRPPYKGVILILDSNDERFMPIFFEYD